MKVQRPKGPEIPSPTAPDAGRVNRPKDSNFADALNVKGEPTAAKSITGADLQPLIDRLRAGEIDMKVLLDTLVERASAGAPLSARGVADLRAMLEALLDADPALRRLTRAIEQG